MNATISTGCDKDRFPAFFEEYQEWRESTTFWNDFSIADGFGIEAVKDTFERAFKEWKSNARYLCELTCVLNHKCWQHYESGNRELSTFYGDKFHQCMDYAGSEEAGFSSDDIRNFYGVLD